MKCYEWTLEEIDITTGDIIDSDFSNNLNSFSDYFNNEIYDIGLVLSFGDNISGLQDRCWAYIKDGKLPEYFSYNSNEPTIFKVPQRFHTELKNYLKQ